MMRSRSPSAAAAARISHASRTPREHQQLVFAWCVRRVRNESRCDGRQRSQPHPCVAFEKRYAMMWSRSPSTVATARKWH
eukprot:2818996-Lingulodinium_polyedra.AAC.1